MKNRYLTRVLCITLASTMVTPNVLAASAEEGASVLTSEADNYTEFMDSMADSDESLADNPTQEIIPAEPPTPQEPENTPAAEETSTPEKPSGPEETPIPEEIPVASFGRAVRSGY
ncbi:MAG: hypothetical protein Q4E89_07100, partial [Eubacteriales bacterium]|nr:hypothetical protein [Eubacteriales bacterium]